MMKAREPKTVGHRGYLKRRKTVLFVRALILCAVMAALIVTGVLTTGTVKNLFTVFGLLLAIPFAMQLATFFSILPYKAPEEREYEQVYAVPGAGVLDTEILIANKDGASFYFPYICFHPDGIYGLLKSKKADSAHVSDYVRNYLRLHDADAEFTVFNDLQAFLDRIGKLPAAERDTVPEFVLKGEGVVRSISI